MKNKILKKATLGGGCFWCTEAVYRELKGVTSVVSGYAGGFVANPTYKQVCSGETNHAEVIQIVYDEAEISFVDLLKVFFATHDPTSLNRQGEDVGTQYRSVVFYHDEEQYLLTKNLLTNFNEQNVFGKPVVTQLEAFDVFYPAENYHQDYAKNNPENEFCKAVVIPKREKFKMLFHTLLKQK
ncbi:MAG: peptide-methionine (S)-S-oxide reductase MsrA [Mangrovibacterium sp.]